MSRKRYYGYKKPDEYYSACFRDDAADDRTIKVGSMISIEFRNGEFILVRVNWGAEEDWDRSRDGEVEMTWYFDEENTKKLMLRTGTHNGKDLIRALYERFKKHARDAEHYIIQWCDEKEINYFPYVHY